MGLPSGAYFWKTQLKLSMILWLTLGVAISTSFPRFFHGGLYHFVRVHVDTSRPNNTSEAFVPVSFRLPMIRFNQTWTTAPLHASLNHTNSSAELLFFDKTAGSLENNTQDLDNFMNYTAAQLDSLYKIVDSFKQKIQDPWVHFRDKGNIFNLVNETLDNFISTDRTVGTLHHKTQNLHNYGNHTTAQMNSVYEIVDSIKQKVQDPWVHFINRGNVFKLDNGTVNNATTIETATVGLNKTFAKALTKNSALDIINTTSTGRTESEHTENNEPINETDELNKSIKKETNSEYTSEDLKHRIYRDIKEFCNINAITSEYCQIMMVNESVEVIPLVNVTRETKKAGLIVNLINDTLPLFNLTEGAKSIIDLGKELNSSNKNFKKRIFTVHKTEEETSHINSINNNETTSTVNQTEETTTILILTEESTPINLTIQTPPQPILTKETTYLFDLTNETNPVNLSKEINSNNSTLVFKPTLLKRIKRVTNTDEASLKKYLNNTITSQKNGTKHKNQELVTRNENQSTKFMSVEVLPTEVINTTNTLNTSFSQPEYEKQNKNNITKFENQTGETTSQDASTTVAINTTDVLNTSSQPDNTPIPTIKPDNTINATEPGNTINIIVSDKSINTIERAKNINTTEPAKFTTSKTLPVAENSKETLTTNSAENSSGTFPTLEGDTTKSNKVYNTTETTARTDEVFEVPNGMNEDETLSESAYNTYGTPVESQTQSYGKQQGALKKLEPSVPTNNDADDNSPVENNDPFANGDVMKALVIPIFLVVLMGSVLFAMHNMSRYFVQRTNNNRQTNESNDERQPPGGTDVIQLNVIIDNPNETIATNATSIREETGNANQTLQEIA